jgi:general secretion pathway protein D
LKTLKWLPAWVTLGLSLGWACPTLAAGHGATGLLVVAATTSQAAKAKPDPRAESDSLLVRARAAIKAGKTDEAEALLQQAEKLKVDYGWLHFGDTPKKVRADLNAAARTGKREAPKRPSEQFTAEPPAVKAPQRPPTAAAAPAAEQPGSARPTGAAPNPGDDMPLAIPQSEGRIRELATPLAPASPGDDVDNQPRVPVPSAEQPAESEDAQSQAQSDSHLVAARRALAVGDIRRAGAELEAVRQLNLGYGPHDDSPDKVETAIRNYRQAMEVLNSRGDSEATRHQLADVLMDQALELARWQDYDEAERLVQSVKGMHINYGPFEAKPDALLAKIAAARRQAGGAAAAKPERLPPTEPGEPADSNGREYPESPASYDASADSTREMPASAYGDPVAPTEVDSDSSEALPTPDGAEPVEAGEPTEEKESAAQRLVRQGEEALRERDLPKAVEYLREAYKLRDQLDSVTVQRVQDHLQLLSAPQGGSAGEATAESTIDAATAKQQLQAKQLLAEVAQKQLKAQKFQEKDPKRAMELLNEARASIEAAGVDAQVRTQLTKRVDRSIADLDKYIEAHRAQIELDSANKDVLKEVERRRNAKVEVDDKLAKLVDEFNKLMDEQRWAEAEVLAKRARELDPENPIVKQLIWQSRFVSRTQRNNNLKSDKEKGVFESLDSVEQAAIPFDDREPYRMPDAKKWDELTKSRKQRFAEGNGRRSPAELEMERKLKTPVSCKFRNRPLSEVLDHLAKLSAVNLYLDPKGLGEEGVTSDSPITIDLTQDISLKSALNLILEPLHLSYVIQNEVLKITSEQLRDGVLMTRTYNVADLVIPIPNFVPNGRNGLSGAISEAYNMSGGGMGMGSPGTAYLASHDGAQATGIVSPNVLAQMNQMMGAGGSRPGGGAAQSVPFGPGGVGSGVQPDFDTLVDLITTTIKPQTWDEVGGPGSVSRFPNNLSLVISQTQEVHEEIVDLLDQLRRNQDLQVTIEVRFITLNDNFFERIGVDFQFNLNTYAPRSPIDPATGQLPNRNLQEIVGIDTVAGNSPGVDPPAFTPNLDIPFRQSSFNLATPQFGQPVEVAHFGFAILSDLEAFFLVNAAQGDRRSNVLQAPKVTLFNGQQASVIDTTQTPFVISVIPVVGDFAAAYQPVITVLSEGTALTVQAVISNDRRFVRLTVVPFFSQVGDVTTFTFSGSKSTTSKSSSSTSKGGSSGDSSADSDDSTTTSEGITLQLPNFSVVTVNTTVSVPDGGTVLLGGIKRLSEGRNEFGVPLLSKLPYINRLFKNVGIGRETQSLMMMVTPRIIIQEEEEERMGIQAPPP